MKFFRRLSRKTDDSAAPAPLKIKLDSYTWLLPILVFLANLFLVFPFFGRPLPQTSFTAPILPILSGGREEVARFLILVAYILGPVFLYFYVLEITGKRLTSFLASLIYTLPTTRIFQIFIFGDVSHIFALNFLPLVLIFFLRFLRQSTSGRINLAIISGIGIVLIALTSPFALFTLLIFIFLLTYSEMLLGQGRAKLLATLLVLASAVGLSAFWYHPGFVIKIFQGEQGRALLSIAWSLVPPSFFLLPIFGAFSFLIFDRRPNLQPIFLGLSPFLIFYLVVFVGTYVSTSYVPVPSRFLPELSLAAAFLFALILVGIGEVSKTDFVGRKFKLPFKWLPSLVTGYWVFVLTFLLAGVFFAHQHLWAFAEGEVQAVGIKLGSNGGGIAQVFGNLTTILTILTLGFLKLKTRISKI